MLMGAKLYTYKTQMPVKEWYYHAIFNLALSGLN